MRNRSKEENSRQVGQFESIPVDDSFPVGIPDFNTRSEYPDVGPHIHDLLEIGYCFDGPGVFLIAEKMFPFKAGDAVIINTREVHVAQSTPGHTTSWGFVHLDPIRLLADNVDSYSDCLKLSQYCGPEFKNIIDGDEHPEIAECIRRILLEIRERPKNYRSMIRSLCWQLLLWLNRSCRVENSTGAVQDYHDLERIYPALKYLNDHYSSEIDSVRLAALCFTSESNFRKLFRKAMGCAPQPYLLRLRLNVACTMLKNSDASVLEIAQRCGYRSLSNFNRQFHARLGAAPRDFRKQG